MTKTRTTPIAYTQFGHDGGSGTGFACAGYGSVDLTDEDAQDVIDFIAADHRRPAADLLAGIMAAPDAEIGIVSQILTEMRGRFLVSFSDKQPAIAAAFAELLIGGANDGTRDLKSVERVLADRVLHEIETSTQGFAGTVACLERLLDTCDIEAYDDIFGDTGGQCWDTPKLDGLAALLAQNEANIAAHVNRHRPIAGLAAIGCPRQGRDFLCAHNAAWGQKHRLISVTVADTDIRGLGDSHFGGLDEIQPFSRRIQGTWDAWRLSGPVAFIPCRENAALQLARFVAWAVAYYASFPATKRLEDWGDALVDHNLGEPYLSSALEQEYWGEVADRVARREERDASWATECDGRLHANAEALLSNLIMGNDLRQCRDRLLFKMLGRSVPIETVLGLTIEGIDVDHEANLRRPNEESARDIIYAMDSQDEDDFWTIMTLAEEFHGPVFADLGKEPRRALTALEVDAIGFGHLRGSDLLVNPMPAKIAEDVCV